MTIWDDKLVNYSVLRKKCYDNNIMALFNLDFPIKSWENEAE